MRNIDQTKSNPTPPKVENSTQVKQETDSDPPQTFNCKVRRLNYPVKARISDEAEQIFIDAIKLKLVVDVPFYCLLASTVGQEE